MLLVLLIYFSLQKYIHCRGMNEYSATYEACIVAIDKGQNLNALP